MSILNTSLVSDLITNTGKSLISQTIASHNQLSTIHSLNYVDVVALSVNNGHQELRKLFKSVQHHTIVDVFLCLSFASLPVMGKLRLALAITSLWWGGGGNKPFIRRIPSAVDLTVFEPPCRPNFGANNQNIIALRKGISL